MEFFENRYTCQLSLKNSLVNKSELDHYKIRGYNAFSKCNDNYRAGGVAIFVRDPYCCYGVTEREDITSADVLLLNVKVNDNESFTVIAVYRLHSSRRVDFINQLDSLLDELNGENIVLIGDMNYDIFNESNESDDYISMLSSKGLLNLINEPTRVVGNSATCIDHVFVRFSNGFNRPISHKFTSKVFHYGITDHSTIVFSIEFPDKFKCIDEISINRTDFTKLGNTLVSTDWSEVFSQRSVSLAFESFFNISKPL